MVKLPELENKPTYEELEKAHNLQLEKEKLLADEIVKLKTQTRELQKNNQQLLKNPSLVYSPLSSTTPFETLSRLLIENFPPEEIKKELGNLLEQKNNESNFTLPLLTVEDQKKVKEIEKTKEQLQKKSEQLETILTDLINKLKKLIGIEPEQDLPFNWIDKIVKRSDLNLSNFKLSEWEEEFPNATPKQISQKISQLMEKNFQKEEGQKTVKNTITIYFCDICQTTKNSKIDGEVYLVKISIRPNIISSVCPACRPDVVVIQDDNKWKDF